MGYVTPADAPVTDNYQDHLNRNSFSPGTDYATTYGTDCRIPASGIVVIANNSSNSNGDGRKLRIHCDDGRELDMLHASWINASIGQHVNQGQHGVFYSGASGFSNNYYYDPHVHVTLREHPGLPDGQTINFENYIGKDPEPEPEPEEEEMAKLKGAYYTNSSGTIIYLLFNEVSGYYTEYSGTDAAYNNAIAANWETNSFSSISESHAKAIKRDLDAINPTANVTNAALITGAGALVAILIAMLIGLRS